MTKKICKECGHETGFTCDTCKDLGFVPKSNQSIGIINGWYSNEICPDCKGASAPQNIPERQLR